MDPPSEAWGARARLGDRRAFDELVKKHRDQLAAAVCVRLAPTLRSRIDVEDVLQETFFRAFRAIDRFRYEDESSFLRWLVGIAHNVVREVARRQRLEVIVPVDAVTRADQVSPSEAGRRDERFGRLEEALHSISPEHRQVITLARLDRLPLKEVARRMDRTPGAVKQLLLRALRSLRQSFGSTDSFHLPPRSLTEDSHHGG